MCWYLVDIGGLVVECDRVGGGRWEVGSGGGCLGAEVNDVEFD